MRVVISILFCLVLAVGCSDLDEEDGGSARLEVINDTVVSVTVLLDEKSLGTIERESDQSWIVLPGAHLIEIRSADGERYPSRDRHVEIAPGENYVWRLN